MDDTYKAVEEDPDVTSERYSKASAELANYLLEKHIKFGEMDWWQLNGDRYPNLAKLARKYLCVPATSVASELIFSKSGEILSKKRSRLSPNRVDMLIFLKHNYLEL